MAGNSIRVSTDLVLQAAGNIERLNGEMEEVLNESRSLIDGLQNIWQGEAAQETVSSFDAFASRYFQNYREVIQQYVTFLRNNVAAGYAETESINIGLAGAFK